MKVYNCILLFATTALASYGGNLNYRSPSTEHPALGLDLVKITKRDLAKRDAANWPDWNSTALNFTHSVASVGRDRNQSIMT